MLLLVALLPPRPLGAQERHEHKVLLPNGIEGTLSKGYRVVKGDTVLLGDWRLHLSRPAPLDRTLIGSVELEGRYEQGLRSGNWTFSAKELRTSEEPIVVGYQVVHTASGIEHLVSGPFHEGQATGRWNAVEQRIDKGRPLDTLFHGQYSFSEGRPMGQMSSWSPNISIRGGFGQGGLLDGEWRSTHRMPNGDNVVEVRMYEAGILREHWFERGKSRTVVEYAGIGMPSPSDASEWRVMDLDPDILGLLALTGQAQDALLQDGSKNPAAQSDALLLRTFSVLVHHDGMDIWTLAKGGPPPGPGRIKLKEYAYTEGEAHARDEAVANYAAALELITRSMNEPLTDLGQHAYEEFAYHLAVMAIHKKNLAMLANIMALLEHPLSRFIDRRAFLSARAPLLEYPAEVVYTFKEDQRTKVHAFPPTFLPQGSTVQGLREHLAAVLKDLQSNRRKVDAILDKYRSQSLLVAKEERLVRKRDSLLALYGNTAGREDFNAHHQRLAAPMRDLVLTRFKEYASLDQQGKLDRIDALLACYNEGIDVYNKQVRAPMRIDRVEEIYTRSVWNPHTFTYMDERIKERLYRAYENVLLPLVLTEMGSRLECGKLMPKQQNLEKLYLRMIDLREQDTRGIERQLRRGMDAEEVLRILELQLDLDR